MTRDALRSYEELLRLYPTSSHIPEAREDMRMITDRLAAHELTIGSFYSTFYGKGICQATIQRLENLPEDYPSFTQMDEVHYYLGMAYRRCRRGEDADRAFETLRRDYPDSPFVPKVEKFEKQFARELAKAVKKGG